MQYFQKCGQQTTYAGITWEFVVISITASITPHILSEAEFWEWVLNNLCYQQASEVTHVLYNKIGEP